MMPIRILFWFLMIVALLFGGLGWGGYWVHGLIGMNFLLWVILALLGWKVFGPILQDN